VVLGLITPRTWAHHPKDAWYHGTYLLQYGYYLKYLLPTTTERIKDTGSCRPKHVKLPQPLITPHKQITNRIINNFEVLQRSPNAPSQHLTTPDDPSTAITTLRYFLTNEYPPRVHTAA
jgi:hypothetical protein